MINLTIKNNKCNRGNKKRGKYNNEKKKKKKWQQNLKQQSLKMFDIDCQRHILKRLRGNCCQRC